MSSVAVSYHIEQVLELFMVQRAAAADLPIDCLPILWKEKRHRGLRKEEEKRERETNRTEP